MGPQRDGLELVDVDAIVLEANAGAQPGSVAGRGQHDGGVGVVGHAVADAVAHPLVRDEVAERVGTDGVAAGRLEALHSLQDVGARAEDQVGALLHEEARESPLRREGVRGEVVAPVHRDHDHVGGGPRGGQCGAGPRPVDAGHEGLVALHDRPAVHPFGERDERDADAAALDHDRSGRLLFGRGRTDRPHAGVGQRAQRVLHPPRGLVVGVVVGHRRDVHADGGQRRRDRGGCAEDRRIARPRRDAHGERRLQVHERDLVVGDDLAQRAEHVREAVVVLVRCADHL